MSPQADASSGPAAVVDVVWWLAALVGLTAVAVIWLTVTGIDPTDTFSPAILLAAYAPLLAALAISALRGGTSVVGALLRQVLTWRVGLGWYALVLLAPAVLVMVANAGYVLLDEGAGSTWLTVPSAAALGAVVGPVIAGSVGEEIGWRGFVQPRLQLTCSALTASLVIGVLWATWHQWPLLAPGVTVEPLDVLASYLRLISTAVLYGWLYNMTRSLLLVMIAHAGHNLAVTLIPTPTDPDGLWHLLLALTYLVAASVVVPQLVRFPRSLGTGEAGARD